MFLFKLAAEAGGNCQATVPGELVVKNGVTIIGNVTLYGDQLETHSLVQVILTSHRGCQRSHRPYTRITSPSFFCLLVKGTTTPLT
jgi:hypothetical protein